MFDFENEMLQICVDFERTYNKSHIELLNAPFEIGFAYMCNLGEDTVSGTRFSFRSRYLNGDKFEKHERNYVNKVLTDFTKQKTRKKDFVKSEQKFLKAIGW